ncbi:MAG: DUF91 domain-containing protein [Anaerolineae bacterium]|nr:DUF91 domain-containing protein [Anaerolineae bacterium]
MPIYDKPVWLLMRDMVTALGLQKGQILTRQEVLAWFKTKYPKIKAGTVNAHLSRMSTNAPTRVHYSAKKEDDLFFQIDGSHFRLYDPATDPPPIYEGSAPTSEGSSPVVSDQAEESEGTESPTEFAYERDLRNFLAKNLSLLEPGPRLYEEEGITGIEFPVGGRFIDILALDTKNNYVVIELKVSRGYDRVIGQLLRYIGWIKQNQAESSQGVRGIIVAREITQDLLLACSELPNISLFEYQLAVTLKSVN